MILRKLFVATVSVALLISPLLAQDQSILRRGNLQDPYTLDPQRISTVYENNIILDLFEGLVTVNTAAQLTPGVAESWTVSGDGLKWTFKLRPNLVWSDGIPLTIEDVIFSFQRLLDPTARSQYPHLFYSLKNAKDVHSGDKSLEMLGVEAGGTHKVIFHLESPVPSLPELLSNGFSVIVPRHAIEKYGDEWAIPGRMPSNGAFSLAKWRPQESVKLIRNANYRGVDDVLLRTIIYVPSEDQAAAVAQFRSGMLDTNMGFPPARTAWLKDNFPDEVRVAPYLITFYLTFNTTKPGLSDSRVRRALSLAIDRTTLARRVLRSGEQAAWTFVPPYAANYVSPDIGDSSQSLDQRLEVARALLAEAGYGKKNPLRFSYSVSSGEDRMRVAHAVVAMWSALDVQVTLNNTESKVLFSRLRSGDFDVGYAAWAADVNDAANFLGILHSQSTNSNYSRFYNSTYDALLDKAVRAESVKSRNALLSEAEAILLQDVPIAPLFYGVSKSLVSRHVMGWLDNPRDLHLSRYLSFSMQSISVN
ncbi:MAG: peptide ABC transporter substrate-binding protein [Rhodospirillaceae bacterium]